MCRWLAVAGDRIDVAAVGGATRRRASERFSQRPPDQADWSSPDEADRSTRITAMSNLQGITDAIDERLDELRQQIASLEAARRALTGTRRPRPSGPTDSEPAAAAPTRAPGKPRRSRATTQRRPAGVQSASGSPSAPSTSDHAEQPTEVTPPAKAERSGRPPAPAAAAPPPSTPPRSTAPRPANQTARRPRPAKSSPRARRRELEPGEIEGLLGDSEEGLSLVALARRLGVSEAKVTERLTTLERSGEVRKSGPRRTSLWRQVTDEERIAERAAELARASQTRA
jgi:hypothetical protein